MIENLAAATPAEIDGELNRLGQAHAVQEMRAEQYAKAAERHRAGNPRQADAYEAQGQQHADKAAELAEEMAPLNAEFQNRGGWTRAFLVSNNNGHVHKDMHCGTCFPSTRYAWMTDFSGMDEVEIVDAAGERACTVCYPSAPVAVLAQPTRMFTPEEKERQAERAEREAKKAVAQAAQVVTASGQVFKTERAASNAVVAAVKDIAHYGWKGDPHPSNSEWIAEAKEAAEAFAAKTGTKAEDKIQDAIVKAAAQVIKDAKDWNKSPMSNMPQYNGKVEVPAKADVIAGVQSYFA